LVFLLRSVVVSSNLHHNQDISPCQSHAEEYNPYETRNHTVIH
jgi:hypothetical protein